MKNRLGIVAMGGLAVGVVGLGACAPNADDSAAGGSFDPPVANIEPIAVEHREVVTGLRGPTQLAVDDEGMWWLATINGAEDSRRGQVVVINPAAPTEPPNVVLDGLDKPTGIALFANELWVMERNRLTRGDLSGGERQVVIDNLPFNGRSEGSLTVDGDRLLYDTSGSQRDGVVVKDSGVLWAVDAEGTSTAIATGFKHAYAQVRAADGTLFTTEIGDGSFDGAPPEDEVVAVVSEADHGWPMCVGDNRPVKQYGATNVVCADVPASHVVFKPGATPTSIVVAPWAEDTLLVALWNEGRVVAVDAAEPGSEIVEVLTEVEHPQHLAVAGDVVLVTDHSGGSIIELSAS